MFFGFINLKIPIDFFVALSLQVFICHFHKFKWTISLYTFLVLCVPNTKSIFYLEVIDIFLLVTPLPSYSGGPASGSPA